MTAFFIAGKINDMPSLDINKLYKENTTKIFDINNNLIAEIGVNKQEFVSYDNISKNMIMAIVAIEDNDFFIHDGLNYKRIVGAALKNIKNKDFSEGASTITQQLIKNVYLTNEKTIERKIQEILLAKKIETLLTKEEIMEAYLNNILFSNRIYGISIASRYFFSKAANELTILESAILAGMIQLPNYYNPFKNLEETKKRTNLVLKRMLDLEFISFKTYQELINEDISNLLHQTVITNNINSNYIDYVLKEVINKGFDPYSQGLEIYTNLDPSIQNTVNQIMENKLTTFPDEKMKAGIVVLDNANAKILAIGGNREIRSYGLNYATDVLLSPASTIKPILDFAPAFEYLNYGTGSIIIDEEMNYKNGQKINNWDKKYKGNITLRQALVESRNIPAIKLYNKLDDKAFIFARNLGLNPEESTYESNAIGAFNYGYTVLQMANAYLAFANSGVYQKASTIKEIRDGEKTYSFLSPKIRVMQESTAFMINDILHDVIKNTNYNLEGMYLMAKTGQTNYSEEEINKYKIPRNATKDSWYMGYSKQMTIGVWTGYDIKGVSTYLNASTKEIPKKIFYNLMKKHGVYSNETYTIPKNVISVLIDNSEIYPKRADFETAYNKKSYEYFIKGTEPK